MVGRHHAGPVRRRWWRPVRVEVYSEQPRLAVDPPTVPYGLPAIPHTPITDDNARWLLNKLANDRAEAWDFIEGKGLGHEFLEWRRQQ